MSLQVQVIPALNDNYIYLLIAEDGEHVGVVDPGDAGPVIKAVDHAGLKPTHIFNTHHHGDHTAGNHALKQRFDATVIGPASETGRIPELDEMVREGETVSFGPHTAKVIETPGHTSGHIIFWFEEEKIAFVGDTLFVMGCGRLLEGNADQMWDSLTKLMAMPADTQLYCGHEYTVANARFARSVDPTNDALSDRLRMVEGLRSRGLATVPTTMAEELATNPFLRAGDADIQAHLDMQGADPNAVFAEIRRRKDAA
ncbi:MAG: hydroxyacylglutathione hydrolase [Alphaproteobacteria bacterium]|nr:hydroxyacylglutathione hydrolase [Alphaproteobacteria bacterium SS10]